MIALSRFLDVILRGLAEHGQVGLVGFVWGGIISLLLPGEWKEAVMYISASVLFVMGLVQAFDRKYGASVLLAGTAVLAMVLVIARLIL